MDGLQGGSGESFDWHRLRQQAGSFAPLSTHGWMLAGGLTPETVAGEAWACAASEGAGLGGRSGSQGDPT